MSTASAAGHGALLGVSNPPQDMLQEFEHWYERRHMAARIGLPGFISARRYWGAIEGTTQHLAVYELTSPEALSTAAYGGVKRAAQDDTELRIRSNMPPILRGVYERGSQLLRGNSPGKDLLLILESDERPSIDTRLELGKAADRSRSRLGCAAADMRLGSLSALSRKYGTLPRHLHILEMYGDGITDAVGLARSFRGVLDSELVPLAHRTLDVWVLASVWQSRRCSLLAGKSANDRS